MRPMCIYRVSDIPADCSPTEKRRVLKKLSRGGVVDELPGDGYGRKRLYVTRQQDLFRGLM